MKRAPRPKIRKATDAEREAYWATKPVYPLFGFIEEQGHTLAIEDLRGCWDKGDPIYEVISPDGFHFGMPDMLHTMLCYNQKDVVDRVHGANIEPCTPESCPQEHPHAKETQS